MSEQLVKRTAQVSTFAQILFGISSFVGFLAPIKNEFLTILLIADIAVQIIELIFYLIFVCYKQLPVIYRYIDWYITTPIQLISTIALLSFFVNKTIQFDKFVTSNRTDILFIVSMNFLMLSFGLLAEIYTSFKNILVTIGIVPFVANFYIMYNNYALQTTEGFIVNTYVCIIWLLYGIAAYMTVNTKTIMYNILDIFSKNFYGFFIGIYMFII